MTEQEKQDIILELMSIIRSEGLEYGGNPITFDDPFNITQTERQNVKIPAIDERKSTVVHGNVDLEALLQAYGVTHVEEIASDISSKYMKKTADSDLDMNSHNITNAGNMYTKTDVDTALNGKVDNMYQYTAVPSSAGWYNIGVLRREVGYNVMARLLINASYANNPPNGGVVDIAGTWHYAGITKAVDIPANSPITKVRLRRIESNSDRYFYIDLYYSPNVANSVVIYLRPDVGVFEGNGFTAVTDLGATSVVAERDLTEWENPPMQAGVEYKTTERWNGKVVYTKLVNCGTISASGSVSTGITLSTLIEFRLFAGNVIAPYGTSSSDLYYLSANSNGSNVTWTAGSALAVSGRTVYAILKYTKD